MKIDENKNLYNNNNYQIRELLDNWDILLIDEDLKQKHPLPQQQQQQQQQQPSNRAFRPESPFTFKAFPLEHGEWIVDERDFDGS